MARVIGNPFGEMRGKLAGIVFSKNAAGPIVRQYVIPTNANTESQNESRQRFKSAAMIWKTLTQSKQQGWEVFAKTAYVPLRKVNMGQFTGNQAHNAIVTSANTCNPQAFETTWVADPPGVDPVCAGVPFAPPGVAPLFSVIPEIAQVENPPATLEFDTFELTSLGVLSFHIAFMGVPAEGLDADEFIDPNNKLFTFAAYISDVVNVEGNRPRNQFYQRIGNASLCNFPVSNLSGFFGIGVSWSCSSLIPKFKSFPQAGQVVQITIVCVGEEGTQAVAGSGYVTLS